MPGGYDARRLHRSRLAVVVLYAFILAASAFFHHDFACHQNSRTHCTACSVSQYAQKAESNGAPLDVLPLVAGRVEFRAPVDVDTLVLLFISDRAPPA
jgi:hypothetical protein